MSSGVLKGSRVKGLALGLGVACVVWLVVLWRWQVTLRAISTEDILLQLGLLPLVAVAGVFGLRWAWGASGRAQQAKKAAQETAALEAAQGAAAAAPLTAEERERGLSFRFLGAHLLLAAGDSAQDVAQALLQGSVTPGPDAELQDSDGLPVFSSRLPDLDAEGFEAESQQLLQAVRMQGPAAVAGEPDAAASWQAQEPCVRVWRSLAAAQAPLEAALMALHEWPEQMMFQGAESVSSGLDLDLSQTTGATAAAKAQSRVPPLVRVIVGLPVGSTAFELALAERWARDKAIELLGLATNRLVVQARALTGPALWQRVEYTLMALHRQAQHDVLLVLAAHSDIDEAHVLQLEEEQRLFVAPRFAKGLIPGEGAAALLVAGTRWPAPADDPDTPPVHLHRAAVLMRDKPVDAAGRVDGDVLKATLEQALSAARLQADTVVGLVTDGDRHSPRNAELFGATTALLPGLDAAEDVAQVGAACAHLGAVGFLAALALAAERAMPGKGPALAVSQVDATSRLALVVRRGPGPDFQSEPQPADAPAPPS